MSKMSSCVSSVVFALSLLLLPLVVTAGCSSSTPSTAVVDGGLGFVMGAVDDHCAGVSPILTSQASCHVPADAAVPSDDGGASDDGGEPMAAVLDNAEGDDDDCKYHVKVTSTPVLANQNVTFTITATKLAENNAPATNANVQIESYLADNNLHPIPNNGTKTAESPANSGRYTLGPVRFDASGRWIVRFHFYESCDDIFDDSPHGHIAFFYDVP